MARTGNSFFGNRPVELRNFCRQLSSFTQHLQPIYSGPKIPMRVRILKQSSGIIEGVSLRYLLPGLMYEVPVSLGAWLVGQKAAEEDVSGTVGIVIPLDQKSTTLTGGIRVPSPATDTAEDRPAWRRRILRKKR